MALTDEQVVAQIIAGDHEKYELIVSRYQKKLERYIRRLTNRSEDVDDLLQEVFIKAYKNLRRFNQKLQFSSWIYRIAHNESVNLIKSSWIQKITSLEPLLLLSKENEIENKLERHQLKQKMANCLEQLPIKYREPLVLYYFEDKSYQEISDILRLNGQTVGVLIHRAKNKLKKLCQKK